MNPLEAAKKRAAKLLKELSLEEKMGQLTGYYPKDWSPEEMEREYPHGVGQIACFGMRSLDTPQKIAAWQREIQKKAMELSEHHIPAIFHVEGLCGTLVWPADSFPSGIGRGATWDPALEKMIGDIVGKQARAIGASQVLAPVLDISRDARFGRQGESYGEDPALTAAMGTAYIKGIQAEREGMRIQSAAKHFLAYHNSQGGIHVADCQTPSRLLREVYAKPFQAAITEGDLRGIMPSYGTVDGMPVSASEELLQRLLRDEMGFDGMVISDYNAISEIHDRQKLGESIADAGEMALKAGIDMELPTRRCYGYELMQRFQRGEIGMELLDRAVFYILTEKYYMGLFENPFAMEGKELENCFYRMSDRQVNLRAARESIVLLKNDGLLPLKRDVKKIAVIGYHGASIRAMFGGYTHMSMTERWLGAANTMAGMTGEESHLAADRKIYPGSFVQKEHPEAEHLARILKPFCSSLAEELAKRMPDSNVEYSFGYPYAGTEESGFEEALQLAEKADLVLVTLGGKYGTGSMASTGEGIDSVNVNLPPCQEHFLKQLKKLGKSVIAVHFDGRPISSDMAEMTAGAILEAWTPGEWGAEAIVDVLLGEYNPAGRLPVSVAYEAGQEPIYYNHPNGSGSHQGTIGAFCSYIDRPYEPRYAFGYGLSYTCFRYSNLKIHQEDDLIQIELKVRNCGEMDGEEVVQIYWKDEYASMLRPVMELVAWKRSFIKAGEEKHFTFTVQISQIAFLNQEMVWIAERGKIMVLAGASSEDIRLTGEFFLEESRIIDSMTRGFYGDGKA